MLFSVLTDSWQARYGLSQILYLSSSDNNSSGIFVLLTNCVC